MLFTDSDIITPELLTQVDNEVLSVAGTTELPIGLSGFGSVIELAWAECATNIQQALQSFSSSGIGMSVAGVQAVLNTGQATNRPRIRMNQIVAHNSQYDNALSSLQLYLIYDSLTKFFRNASSRFGKDRYDEKMKCYLKQAHYQWSQLISNGIPAVSMPLECPAAKHGLDSGTWDSNNLSSSAGGAASATNYRVAITYYDSSKYTSSTARGNGESSSSEVLTYQVAASSYLAVDITSLVPPTGTAGEIGISQGTYTPLTATHWQLWVGSEDTSKPLYLQGTGRAIATKTATLTAAPVLSGTRLHNGQYADQNIVAMSTIMRG